MEKIDLTKLIEAGAHFGHLTRRWNPKMKPYIFMERNGIHLIDLKKTQKLMDENAQEMVKIASTGKRVLFVGTKKQAKGIIEHEARRCSQNWVTERWLGGMLTNFATIRRSVKRLQEIEKQETDGTFEKITKKERLYLTRERDKLKKVLEGIESMSRLPGALFIVDIKKESIAVKEAKRLNIPVFAIVDTNCDPDEVDYLIPANDDAVKTIELITGHIADAVEEGAAKAKEIKAEKDAEQERLKKEKGKESGDDKKPQRRKPRRDTRRRKPDTVKEEKPKAPEKGDSDKKPEKDEKKEDPKSDDSEKKEG